MGLRDRLQSALTGVPAPADSQLIRTRGDGRPPRNQRPSQGQTNSSTSMTTTRGRASQLTIGRSSTSLPASRSRSGQLAIGGSSAAITASPPQRNDLTSSSANAAQGHLQLQPTASAPALPLARVSRPYGNSKNQEAFTLNPSRGPVIESSRPSSIAAAPKASRTQPSEEGDALPHFSERDIIDVSDQQNMAATGANIRRPVIDDTQRNRFQQPSRASNPTTQAATPQRSGPLTRIPPSARLGNQSARSSTASQLHRGAMKTPSQPYAASHVSSRSQTSSSGPISTTQSSSAPAEQPQGLYLGVFDLEESEDPSQHPAPNTRSGLGQRGTSSRSGSFGQRNSSIHASTSSHRTTVINHGFPICHAFYRPRCFYDYGLGYDFYPGWGYPWGYLPWYPRPHVVLPRQTVFSEVSTDYFEQESSSSPNLDTNTGLEVINRYYHGWRDAYTQALAGNEAISAAHRSRIEGNRSRLQSRQDEAIRRLRDGDQAVVRETLDQVKMDRQMAVDMPVEQIRWATPWIREVWIKEHGEVPD
jgi:hypothetical protein